MSHRLTTELVRSPFTERQYKNVGTLK